jgi:6-phosphogluconolactonase
MRIVVHPDPDTLARAAAEMVATELAAAEPGRRRSLALSGGSTPAATFRYLRERPIDWGSVLLWLSDERWVPPDDPHSNGKVAAETLADHVPAMFLRPRWSGYVRPAEAAAFYEASLRRHLGGAPPDVVLLGMGVDGHTASLFPGTAALDERKRWVVANHVPQLDAWRLTATRRLLAEARTVIVLVAGLSKAPVLARVLEDPTAGLPAQILADLPGEVVWMVDRQAAAELTSSVVERP